MPDISKCTNRTPSLSKIKKGNCDFYIPNQQEIKNQQHDI